MSEKNKIYKQNIPLRILRFILIIILFPIVLVYIFHKWTIYRKLKKREKSQVQFYELSQIHTLSGIEFENTLESLYKKMGYKVTKTKTTGDFGADLILERNGKRCLVQAKRYSHTVGVRAVQEIISAREHYKIKDVLVVTNNRFSAEAEELSRESNVNLIDGELLEKLLIKYDVHIEKTQAKIEAMSDIAISQITAKYKFWI